ncbi:MAG: SDR family oxidoreductase [Planctomycetaceae bacterium]|nr:SDR family oxidoreductase [Planctomycetaceae bacterium]
MDLLLKNKVALVTGAAQGLGKSIAASLHEEGAIVVRTDINFEKAAIVALMDNERLYDYKIDVSKQAQVFQLVNAIVNRFGKIDILVNNAGICPRTEFGKITEQEWDQVLAVNLKSVFMLSQAVLGQMKQKCYGKIVSIASAAGKIGGAQVGAHYSASKAGVICLTKSIALNAASFGINVNAVCPGVINTEMTASISQEKIDKYNDMIPLGRIGVPGDVANAVLFLVSDVTNYITGEIIDVNGGFIMD